MQIKAMLEVSRSFENLEALLDKHFPLGLDETDWQREEAKMAVNQSFSTITGGPGTGKTPTVIKILALLQE
jgi:exodeoxyribonuclease V alpha subunit